MKISLHVLPMPTPNTAEQTAALRAALKEDHGHQQVPFPHHPKCTTCALLAAPDRAIEERLTDDDTILDGLAKFVREQPTIGMLHPTTIVSRTFKAGWLAAVERSRRP